jgi:23S rRNA-/tRNA-specific pseudouridylate synthase
MIDNSMLRIVLENAFFTVLSKPYGLSVHNDIQSVATWLTEQKKPLHFVNRLDRETSGLLVVAHKPELHEPLAESLEHGQKVYRALLCGPWKAAETKRIQWSWPLTDRAEGFKNIQGESSARKTCLSFVELLRTNSYFSEVLVQIKTGRQHQIRKHAALYGQAIAGDNRYGNEKYNTRLAKLYPDSPSRLQLHAEKLSFRFQGQDYSISDPHFSLDHFF